MATLDDTRLIGDDGSLETYTLGVEKVGAVNATFTTLGASDDDIVVITGKAAANSVFGNDLKIGNAYWIRDAATAVTAAEDKFMLVTRKGIAGIVSWDIAITRPEIDVTAQDDLIKVYRYGRQEWNGNITGIRDLQVSEIASRFIPQINFSTTGTPTVTEVDSSPLAFFGWLQKNEVSNWSRAFVFIPGVEIGGWGVGAVDNQRGEFQTPFRITAGATRNVAIYKAEIA